MTASFPIVDKNHHTSIASKHVLDYAHPATWDLTSRDGPSDYGFDLEVQVAPNNLVQYTFRIQLKGTEAPKLSADGNTLSMTLKVSTLNLYAQTADEVMLVVVKVSFLPNGKADLVNSKVYWTWVSDEIERLRGNRYEVDTEGAQREVTLHIPVSQTLTPDFDVVPYLADRLRAARAVESLTSLAQQTRPIPGGCAEQLEQLVQNVVRHPALLTTSFDQEEELLSEGVGKQLAEGLAYARAGRTSLAEKVVQSIDFARLNDSPALTAWFFSLQGKVAMQRRRADDALAFFKKAHLSHPIEKHLLPVAELKFLDAVDRGESADIESVATLLGSVESDDGRSLLVRVLTSMRAYDEAQKTINKISNRAKQLQAQLVLWSSQGKWADIRTAGEAALRSNLSTDPHISAALHLLLSRAAWQQALSTASQLDEDAKTLPFSGLPGLDGEAATRAWHHALECLRLHKQLGWPVNIELLAPVAVAVAGATGKQIEALGLLSEAATERPEYRELQENVEILAVGAGQLKVALEANLRQPRGYAVLARRASIAFQNKDYEASLTSALKALKSPGGPTHQTPMAFALGAAAAAKLSRSADREKLLTQLKSVPSYQEYEALSEFATAAVVPGISQDPLGILRDGVSQFPNSNVLIGNLLSNLPTDDSDAAREAVSLALKLRQHMALSLADHTRLLNAHLVLEEWLDAEMETRAAIIRFGPTHSLQSMLAVALEMQGKTAQAKTALEQAIELGSGRLSTLRNYLGICLRLGRLSEARNAIQRLLASETSREERLELLRLNALVLSQLELADDAMDVVRDVGKLVNVDVETEEGMYLVLLQVVTLNQQGIARQEWDEFQQRVARFVDKWPKSTIFRAVKEPANAVQSVDELHDFLDEVIGGDSRARMLEFKKRENDLRNGRLPVPYAMRPTYALHYIGDVFTLWHVGKKSSPDDAQLHLPMHASSEELATQVRRDVPLLDITALLVLQDLELLPVLLSLFGRIAISRRTVNYISNHSRGALVNAIARSQAMGLMKFINTNLERIDQPSSSRQSIQTITPQELVQDYIALGKEGRWVVYCDDATSRVYLTHENTRLKVFNTLALLELSDREGMLTELEIARHLAQLSQWNVGIAVSVRYLLASLTGAVDNDEQISAVERLERFRRHEPFASLARAIWHPRKDVADLVAHMAVVISEALRDERSNEDSVAALWAFWLMRCKVMFQLSLDFFQDIQPYCLILALIRLPTGAEERLVHAALTAVELSTESDRMSQGLEDQFLERLGMTLAAMGIKNSTSVEDARSRLATVLPRGTHRGDIFEAAYYASLSRGTTDKGSD
ncbi:MAG: DUF4365 domain-containing protein [Acidovorax sp.]|nr:DUF4365 domain-containing protein [Acidovorax sp.]